MKAPRLIDANLVHRSFHNTVLMQRFMALNEMMMMMMMVVVLDELWQKQSQPILRYYPCIHLQGPGKNTRNSLMPRFKPDASQIQVGHIIVCSKL
jgi:hypothetical protein